MDRCSYCNGNEWINDGAELTPVFYKGGHSGPVHLKCHNYIEENPDNDNVRVWMMMQYLDKIDFVKTVEHTRESAQLLLMESKGITEKMVNNFKKAFAEFGVDNG
jgi:hypothetical protein